VLGVSI